MNKKIKFKYNVYKTLSFISILIIPSMLIASLIIKESTHIKWLPYLLLVCEVVLTCFVFIWSEIIDDIKNTILNRNIIDTKTIILPENFEFNHNIIAFYSINNDNKVCFNKYDISNNTIYVTDKSQSYMIEQEINEKTCSEEKCYLNYNIYFNKSDYDKYFKFINDKDNKHNKLEDNNND